MKNEGLNRLHLTAAPRIGQPKVSRVVGPRIMKLTPQQIDGEIIAVFIWDVTGTCGGSAVLYGIARFHDNTFVVERTEEPFVLSIPETAWETLRLVKENDEAFSPAKVMVMLRLGPVPEDTDESEYVPINIPILNENKDDS